MAEASHARIMEYGAGIENAFKAVARIPKPVIAAITGFALGGGLELALCADFRVLGESAKVGQPEILLGIIPGAGGTQRLPRLIGPARAKDLVYSGRVADAAEALRIGLADQVVPDADVYAAARQLADALHATRHRWRCAPPSRPSTRAWNGTWTRAWRSSGCTSPGCSAPRTSRRGCAVSWRTVPGKRRSLAGET